MAEKIIISEDSVEIITETSRFIDLKGLREQKKELLTIIDLPEPTKEEITEFVKEYHPYYIEQSRMKDQIDQINAILDRYSK